MRMRNRAARALSDTSGAGALEFVLVLPVMLAFLMVSIAAGEAFSISRKVEQAARTLTDLASQQTDITSASTGYTWDNILKASALILSPFNASGVTITLTEYQVDSAGGGTPVWSKREIGGVEAPANAASVTGLTGFASPSGTVYALSGTVDYAYSPFGMSTMFPTIHVTSQLYLFPRSGTAGVKCC